MRRTLVLLAAVAVLCAALAAVSVARSAPLIPGSKTGNVPAQSVVLADQLAEGRPLRASRSAARPEPATTTTAVPSSTAATTPPTTTAPPAPAPVVAAVEDDASPAPAEASPVDGQRVESTAYCLTSNMADGEPARRGAVAGNLWPLGTVLEVSDSPWGPGRFTVEDRIGSGSQLDFAMPGDCAGALDWGRRPVSVAVVG